MLQFKSIPGLADLKNQLINIARSNHVPGSLMFSAHNGSSALSLALAMAQYMACDNPALDSCGICLSCKQFKSSNYPDISYTFPYTKSSSNNCADLTDNFLQSLTKHPFLTEEQWQSYLESGNRQFIIPVSEVERITSKLAVKPFSNKPRFFIIWLPEYLHASAANKLLKSLEEPGEGTYFLLITNQPEAILDTIKSRCVSFMVSRYSYNELTRVLSQYANSENINTAILESEGSIGQALSVLEDSSEHNHLSQLFVDWVRLIYTRKIERLLIWAEDTSRLYREELKRFLDFASTLFRQASLQNLHASNYNFQIDTFDLNKFRPFIDSEKGGEIHTLIENARVDISRNGNPKIILLDLSLRLMKYIG